jgi:hypothetical protein
MTPIVQLQRELGLEPQFVKLCAEIRAAGLPGGFTLTTVSKKVYLKPWIQRLISRSTVNIDTLSRVISRRGFQSLQDWSNDLETRYHSFLHWQSK